MNQPTKLDQRDWEEIVAALESKITALKRGDLGAEEHPGQDKKWIAHLRRIIRKIERRRPK
jgi:hypothetical protein